MTESEIQCLIDNIDKTVEIETRSGEFLIAKILFVTHCEEYDEHDLLYQVVSSNRSQFYSRFENSGGFVLDFDEIVSVKPHH
jgi:hypothetical protein